MSTPFDSFQSGLMTGTALGERMRERSQSREIGGLMASGDVAGARSAAFTQGDLRTGMVLDGQVQQQAETARQGQIVGALKTGDFQGASGFAQSPQELAQIEAFKNNASESERAAAVQNAEQLAMVATAIQQLPPAQQFAAAQQYAQQFGMDPSTITPEMVSPQGLEALRMRALGLKDYLEIKADERDAAMPRYVPALGGFIVPPGSTMPGAAQPQQTLGSSLPPGWTPQPRPNKPPSAPAAGGGERSQTPRVSFQSSGEARQAVAQMVPGVRVTNADRTPADTARIRRQGYNPSDTSFHLQGQALDLTPPEGMSMGQLEAKMRAAGFRVLNEGHHIHVSW